MNRIKLLVGSAFILVILLGVGLAYLESGREFTPPTWNSIKIGESSKQEIYNNLGQPISRDNNLESYESNSPTTPHEVVYNNDDKAEFIRQVVTTEEEVTFTSIAEEYGEPTIRLYGPESSFDIYLYVNLASGVAVLGNKEQDMAMEVWYFKPMELQPFLNTWATEYSTSNVPHHGN